MRYNKIYNMDCFDFLKQVDDNSIDLAVADPPYNLSIEKWDEFETFNDFMKFTQRWISELVPKLKKTASLYIFNTPHNSAYIAHYLDSLGLKFQNWIAWNKKDGFSYTDKRFLNRQEIILYYTKSDQYTFNQIRIPYDAANGPDDRRYIKILKGEAPGIGTRGKKNHWKPHPDGRLVSDVWLFASERHTTKIQGRTKKPAHINIKPLKMIERIILASSNENDLVCDPFMGSGTTALACINTRRNYTGCESNNDYFELINQRLQINNKTTPANLDDKGLGKWL